MAEFKMPSMPAPAAAAGAKTDPNAHPLIYEAPFWSAVPTENHGYSLEVISQGSVLGTISLQTKPFYLIGRVPICDVVVENDSISRQHAIIQFRKTGEAYLYDLGSTHGTILNGGAPIAPKTYKRLMAGDSIRFGASSKIFVFEGGPDREEVVVDTASSKTAKQEKGNNESITDAKASTSSASSKSGRTTTDTGHVIPQAKRRFSRSGGGKSENENGDEDFDAETRLEAQLSRKSNRKGDDSDDDEGEVSDEERENAEMAMVANYLGREAIEGSDADDAFYDRTLDQKNNQKQSTHTTRAESYETLNAKLRVLAFVLSAVNSRLSELDKIISSDEKRRKQSHGGGDNGDEEDALDAFMSGMSKTVVEEEERDRKRNILFELQEEEKKMKELENKLKPSEGEIHVALVSGAELDIISDTYYNELTERVQKTGGSIKLQMKSVVPEPKRPKIADPINSQAQMTHTISEPYITAPTIKSERDTDTSHRKEDIEVPKTKNVLLPSSTEEPSVSLNTKKRDRPAMSFAEDDTADDMYTTWQAPTGQTGDGRTSLNDKYGY